MEARLRYSRYVLMFDLEGSGTSTRSKRTAKVEVARKKRLAATLASSTSVVFSRGLDLLHCASFRNP